MVVRRSSITPAKRTVMTHSTAVPYVAGVGVGGAGSVSVFSQPIGACFGIGCEEAENGCPVMKRSCSIPQGPLTWMCIASFGVTLKHGFLEPPSELFTMWCQVGPNPLHL